MMEPNELHTPTPEFRASLERELKRAYRAEQQFDPFHHAHTSRIRHLGVLIGIAAGAVIILTTGLVLGMNTDRASAEGLAASQRDALATTIATSRQFAASRLDIARAHYDSVRRAYEAGRATQAALENAKREVDSMEANAARVEVDAKTASLPAPRSCLSILRAAPVKNALAALACGAAAAPPTTATRQPGIPIIGVTAPLVRTTMTFGAVLGVRELSDGRLLVNDAGRHRLWMVAPGLASAKAALDSAPGTSSSYGSQPGQIIRYLADSTIFRGGYGEPVLMLDANGRVTRAIALPDHDDGATPFPVPFPAPTAADDRGRLYASGGTRVHGENGVGVTADSVLLLRADLDTRKVDVVGALHIAVGRNRPEPPEGGMRVVTTIIQPVPTEDSWAVLSNGTVAFVRGRDYHVDWLRPDGTVQSTGKLPFDWRRLTDDEKQKLVDSAKVVWDSLMTIRNTRVNAPSTPMRGEADQNSAATRRSSGGVPAPGSSQGGSIQRMISVPLSEIPDYYPPIHRNAAMADLDGNVWVLTTTTRQSQQGELVYDVLNPARGLFERVRLPLGRSIAGFGSDGGIYLQSGDRVNGFVLERVKLEPPPSAR
jgi:hypothetical protein